MMLCTHLDNDIKYAGCNACYVGETTRHFSTRVREHLATDRASHVYKHLQQSVNCRDLCSTNCFSILDCVTTSFQLKIKESLHIHWEKPTLNQQVKHVKLFVQISHNHAFFLSLLLIHFHLQF